MNPFDYSLCGQTVTVYRKEAAGVTRQVTRQACLWVKIGTTTESYGKSLEKKFRLIIPGNFPLQPGDRIYIGEGPEQVDWQTFLPSLVPEVLECGFVKPCFWEDRITHWEAGNGKENP